MPHLTGFYTKSVKFLLRFFCFYFDFATMYSQFKNLDYIYFTKLV